MYRRRKAFPRSLFTTQESGLPRHTGRRLHLREIPEVPFCVVSPLVESPVQTCPRSVSYALLMVRRAYFLIVELHLHTDSEKSIEKRARLSAHGHVEAVVKPYPLNMACLTASLCCNGAATMLCTGRARMPSIRRLATNLHPE